MKIDKITNTQQMDIEILEVTLLSTEEYKANKNLIPALSDAWWLRSAHVFKPITDLTKNGDKVVQVVIREPETDNMSMDIVNSHNAIQTNPVHYVNCIRPVLKVKESIYGMKFNILGYTWTGLNNGLILCDGSVMEMVFRKDWRAEDCNQYDKSDVKVWLDRWAKYTGLI